MFVEETLNLGITYGTLSTLTTLTGIIVEGGGGEQRSILWEQPLLRFNIGQRGAINAELAYFIEFHQNRKGAYQGFRFRDWTDWKIENQFLATNDGTITAFQLFKAYTVAGSTVRRPITKPVAGTVYLAVDGVEVFDWTIDAATGVIVFAEPFEGDLSVIYAEFDVPVRFEGDNIALRFEAYEPGTGRKIYNWEGLTLSEIRILPTIPLPIDPVPQSLDHTIDLGFDYGTIGGNEFSTRIDRMVSGHERRESYWDAPKGRWEIGDRTLNLSKLEYLIALFRVCRGRAVGFRYLDRATEIVRSVRFGEDAIAFRFDAYERQTGQVIFNLAGVPLQEVLPLSCLPQNQTFTHPLSTLISWTVFSTSAGNDGLGSVDVEINDSKWRVATNFLAGCSQLWISDFRYIPRHENEIINFTFSIQARMVQTQQTGQLFNFFLIQNGTIAPGGFQLLASSEPVTITAIGELSAFGLPLLVNTPIYLGIGFGNSNGFSIIQNIAEYWNFVCTITVTCSS